LSNSKTVSPEAIVDRQLDAYNKRDITAFLATYHKDVKIYDFPEVLTIDGLGALKERYEPMFKSVKSLNASISKRIVFGDKVIDHETATFVKDRDKKVVHAVVIYEIKEGLIYKVTFIK